MKIVLTTSRLLCTVDCFYQLRLSRNRKTLEPCQYIIITYTSCRRRRRRRHIFTYTLKWRSKANTDSVISRIRGRLETFNIHLIYECIKHTYCDLCLTTNVTDEDRKPARWSGGRGTGKRRKLPLDVIRFKCYSHWRVFQ